MRRRVLLLSAIPVAILIVVGIWYSVFMPKNKEFVNMGEVNIDLKPVSEVLWHYDNKWQEIYIPSNFLDAWRETYRDLYTYYLNHSVDNHSNIYLKYRVYNPVYGGYDPQTGFKLYWESFFITLNITNIYVEKIMFFTDISEFNRSRGWLMDINQYPYTEYDKTHWKHQRAKHDADTEGYPFTYDKAYINNTGLNYTELFRTSTLYVGWDKPRIKVIVYVETREKVYYATFYIRFIKDQYHFVSKPINATYYCFNNTTKSLTISDEIVDGTDYYFFINEDGKMSFIKEVKDNE